VRARIEQLEGESADEAARIEEQASTLLNIQVIKYNNVVITDSTHQIMA
jgi:hypothetical protein